MRAEHWLYTIPLRLRSLFRRRAVETELEEELQYHLDRQIEEGISQGLSPTEARRKAMRAMDGLTRRKEECRDTWGVRAIDNTFQDIRYGIRVLRKSPGFTVVAILTMALAIGANSVVFGLLNGLVLKPLDVADPPSLYGVAYGTNPGWQSYPNYRDLRERNRSFEDLAAFKFSFVGFDTGNDPTSSAGFATSGNYFDILGIRPHLGRFYTSRDEQGPNSAPYIVLSYGYWHSRFLDSPDVLGKTVRLNQHPFTVIGITPPAFHGTVVFISPDFFVPIVNQEQIDGKSSLEERGSSDGVFEIFGRLKPGVTPSQAAAEMDAIGAGLEKTYPGTYGSRRSTLTHPGLTSFDGPVKAFVGGLMLLAVLILLAACANLGSLFASHAAGRSRELALRLALGARHKRIMRQLLTEAVVVSVLGGVAGLAASILLLRYAVTSNPLSIPALHLPVTPDRSVYVIAFAVSVLSGLLFGLVPVRQVLRTDPYQVVKQGSSGRAGDRFSLRDILLVVQIAICAVLVTSSMVAVRGLMRSLDSQLGFDPSNTMVVNVNLAAGGYRTEQAVTVQKRLIDGIAPLAGVENAGVVNGYPPLIYTASERTDVFKDETRDLRKPNIAVRPYRYFVSPGYLNAAGTRLLSGRDFSWHDGPEAAAVALVNRTFAVSQFGSVAGAEGRYFRLKDGTRAQVVGVVEDGKYLNLTEAQQPAIFLPFQNSPSKQAFLVVRSRRDPRELAAALRGRIRELAPGLPVETETWRGMLSVVLLPARAATVSLGVLGMIGAVMSVTGVFGMAASSVSRRLKELGIRLALGARSREVLTAALGRALRLLAVGSAAGVILGVLAGKVLESIVYQASPRDPVVLCCAVMAMGLVGAVATWVPAQRALGVDPVRLLREE